MIRRSVYAVIVAAAGLLVLGDLAIANPALESAAGFVNRLLVVLAAAAALAGALALLVRHTGRLRQRIDSAGSVAVLVGMALVLVPGLVPGSSGAGAPAVRWVVDALMAPLIAAVFSLLFPLLLAAAQRGLRLRVRETALMLAAAAAAVILLLPVGGDAGTALVAAAGWVESVPVAAVFRGLLLGVAAIGALTAARILLGVDGVDE